MALDPGLLRNALARLSRPVEPAAAERVFGGGVAGRIALAKAIAGTEDKKSKAYRTAMRNLQRYGAAEGKQRRAMGQKLRPQISKAVQIRRAIKKLDEPIRVIWKAPVIKVSSDSRQRLDIDVELDPDQLTEVRELLEANDDEAAMEAFAAASVEAYFAGARDALITDAEGLTIRRL